MAHEPAVLPEDILVEVLRRLAPHDLAVSRRVCQAWRNAIDGHLRSQLLSQSVRGIFINYTDSKLPMSEFFSRPSTGPAIHGGLDCLPCNGAKVMDHCNGLLLCRCRNHEYVVNPATQRWACLPPRPPPHAPEFGQTAYLAFDPAVLPHYEVYLIWHMPSVESNDATLLQTEWPPASYVMHVFSSMTGRWDKKMFIRERDAPRDVADMASSRSWAEENRAVYWRGALYVHGQCDDFVMRMCLSNSKFRVIKMPGLFGFCPTPHLGRSMRGVYCAISHRSHELEIWYLDESCGQMKWVLKHDHKFYIRGRYYDKQMDKHWILQDVNYRKCSFFESDRRTYGNYKAPAEEKYEWNSDDDNIILDSEHVVKKTWWTGHIDFLGFHPYKEVVFLTVQQDEVVSYDWNTSKFQYLGHTLSKNHKVVTMQYKIDTCFPYTPCWMYEFPRINSKSRLCGKSLETQVEDDLYDVARDYELHKLRGRIKRAKDSTAKIRQRHRS